MIDFGFGISPSSAIKLDDFDRTKYNKLCEMEPDILKCMACGSCAAVCTAGQFSDMNLRKVILLLGRGRDEEAVKMVEHCLLCGKCLIVCPRGINTRHLLTSIIKVYK